MRDTCDHSGTHHCLPLEQCKFCWVQVRHDLTAMAERSRVFAQIGQELLGLQNQL
jgi:hypothetical protein